HSPTGRRAGDPAKLLASSAKARNLLNWTPKHSSAESLVSTMWNVYKDIK
ncbi:MAG TPA: UDP-glucose 4-epimerase GalE, partial [Leptospiraceae bacterium]|nr:UDP-glucose 4-epimerase GalE [Leptospiraceae bacterium]